MSYVERLLALDMLPLAYDREINDLVFFYKAVYSYIDIDVSNYVTFTSLSCFQLFLKNVHNSLLIVVFDVDIVCPWSISRECTYSLAEFRLMYKFNFIKFNLDFSTVRGQFSPIRFFSYYN